MLQEAAPTAEAAAQSSARQVAERQRVQVDNARTAVVEHATTFDRVTAHESAAAAQRAAIASTQVASQNLALSPQPTRTVPDDMPASLRPRQLPSFADMAPLRSGLQGDLPPARDGDLLRQVAAEVRALRDDLASLSRVLGFATRSGPEFRGVLQQFDRLDSDVQARVYQRDNEERDYTVQRRDYRAGEAEAAAQQVIEQRREQEREVQQAMRIQQAARIAARQRDLVRALQRAQRQLASVPPEQLPAGLRDSVIGEIYKARYSIAVFGGANGAAQLSGLAFQMSA